MQQKNQSILSISSKYRIIGEDATNLRDIEEWCAARKLNLNNSTLLPQKQYNALVQSKTFTHGGARGAIEALLASVGMKDQATAFEVKVPELFILSAYIEPLNGNDVKNAENSQMQDCNTEKEQQLLKRATWEGYARTTPLTQERINAIRYQRHKDGCAHDVVEKEIKEMYTLRVENLKDNLKHSQQELEKAKNQRIINKYKYKAHDNSLKAASIREVESECTRWQQALDSARMLLPQGRIEMYREALDKLDDLQNTNANLQSSMYYRITNSKNIAQINQDIGNVTTHINNIIDKEKETDQSYTNLRDAAREHFMKKREEAEIMQQQTFGAKNSTRNNQTNQH